MQNNNSAAKVTVLHQTGPELLRDAMAAGLLDGKIKQSTERLLYDNTRLNRENQMLRDELREARGMIVNYRAVHLAAYERDRENKGKLRNDKRFFALMALTIASMAASLTMTFMVIMGAI